MSDDGVIVEVRDLRKGYASGGGRLEILSGLDLDVRRGEMLGVTGVSGSGKSTLLHLLGGMDKPDGGSIKVSGRDVAALAPAPLADFRNKTIGFLFQFHHLLPEFTALENVMMPLLLRGEPSARAVDAARGLLDEVGLASRAGHRPGELSGGEQQRAALARALAGSPSLLLADEPTGNLDPKTGDAVAGLLRRLHAERGLTSVVVTHNGDLAARCSRVLRLEDGKLA
ncbi:MAG: ABC transporter ATP-binding protein [Acidobacteriota bacterium]|jgi:lipoprotein-releasing system ATP-binding protein|nr:ABC transporter ATP-binding protein [Acidobacteriota bacterium]